jgi:phage tail protein X
MTKACTYRTVDGDMIDAIAWKHYGIETAMIAIFEANPHLADAGPMLPGGIMITLPALSVEQTTPTIEFIRLWD